MVWFVLILVVVEDGLREVRTIETKAFARRVLILVVVEDGLRVWQSCHERTPSTSVLILVVVEDGLRGENCWSMNVLQYGLNPCCCGRWSQRPRDYAMPSIAS